MSFSRIIMHGRVRVEIQNKFHIQSITQNVAFEFANFGNFHQFCSIEIDLSGNTIWP